MQNISQYVNFVDFVFTKTAIKSLFCENLPVSNIGIVYQYFQDELCLLQKLWQETSLKILL